MSNRSKIVPENILKTGAVQAQQVKYRNSGPSAHHLIFFTEFHWTPFLRKCVWTFSCTPTHTAIQFVVLLASSPLQIDTLEAWSRAAYRH